MRDFQEVTMTVLLKHYEFFVTSKNGFLRGNSIMMCSKYVLILFMCVSEKWMHYSTEHFRVSNGTNEYDFNPFKM